MVGGAESNRQPNSCGF